MRAFPTLCTRNSYLWLHASVHVPLAGRLSRQAHDMTPVKGIGFRVPHKDPFEGARVKRSKLSSESSQSC